MSFRLPTIRITKTFTLEMSHALTGYNGPCKNIHGHSYKLAVTVSGKPIMDASDPLNGMVMDFSKLKSIVQEHVIRDLDHALVLNTHDEDRYPGLNNTTRIIYLPFAPSCEMLLIYICGIIAAHLPVQVKLQSVRLDETSTSYAEWHSDENL